MNRRVVLLLMSLLINALCVHAQGYSNIWHFGDSAGVDFNGPVPVSVGGSVMKAEEGAATISDKYGNLLFYTNGVNVWNRSHVQMPNGFGLSGNTSVTQTIIVKQPGSCDLFYIFTLRTNSDTSDGLRYSIVDMSQSGGLGDVTTKNVLVKKGLTEKITATLHQDSCSVWIMTHEVNTDAFLCYELDKDGFDTIPVVSNTGSVHAEGFVGWGAIGEMKFSRDGSKLAQVTHFYDAFNLNFCEVFDFNNLTGVVSNPIFISDTQYVSAYGLEFSPDASKLYLSVSLLNKIYQFDLLAGGAAAIEASAILVDSAHAYHLGSMQLGPDGKIYVAKRDSTHLGVINNPNALGLACNYNDKGLVLSSGTCKYGLPQLVVNTFDCAKPEIVPDTMLCALDTVDFSIADTSGQTVLGVRWAFGDPASGSADTSFQTSPSHVYSSFGTYSVSLIVNYNCRSDTIWYTLDIDSLPTGVTSTGINICLGDTATIYASGGGAYVWSPATGLSATTGSSVRTSVTANTTYSLVVTSPQGCVKLDTVAVEVLPTPTILVSGNDSVCPGDSTLLSASGGISYNWKSAGLADPPSDSSVNVGAGSYTVTTTAVNGCTAAASFSVYEYFVDPIDAGPDQTISKGDVVDLSATGDGTIMWSPAANITCDTCAVTSAMPEESGYYYLLVTDNNGCSSIDSVFITVDELCADAFIPNAFSPNGDGENDLFFVQGACITEMIIIIYDRWGERIAVLADPADVWDGTYKGAPMNTGSYFYQGNLVAISGEEVSVKGSLTLLR